MYLTWVGDAGLDLSLASAAARVRVQRHMFYCDLTYRAVTDLPRCDLTCRAGLAWFRLSRRACRGSDSCQTGWAAGETGMPMYSPAVCVWNDQGRADGLRSVAVRVGHRGGVQAAREVPLIRMIACGWGVGCPCCVWVGVVGCGWLRRGGAGMVTREFSCVVSLLVYSCALRVHMR